MEKDQYEIVISTLAEKIEDLQDELAVRSQSLSRWVNRVSELQHELFELKKTKKRGPGRPRKVKK